MKESLDDAPRASAAQPAAPHRRLTEPPIDLQAVCREAARLLEIGEPLSAYDLASSALADGNRDVRLRQLRGIALSRSGAVDAASAVFEDLLSEGHDDEETLGNLARTFKTRWLAARGQPAAESLRRKAYAAYVDAYRRTGGYWSGINAATLALAGRDDAAAAALAREVLASCQSRLAAPASADDAYWLHATCGEACLALGQVELAADWYRQAAALAGRRYANIASTRAQARLVGELVDVPWDRLAHCFPLPRVVAVSGHMIDEHARPQPRFAGHLADAVRREIDRRLALWGAVIGYSSAACGADLLFLEAMADRGLDAVIVLPFAIDEFARASVSYAGPEWTRRFEAMIRHFDQPVVASNWAAPHTGIAFDYGNRMLCGLTKLQADQFEVAPTLLAIWDGAPSGRLGGTASVVARWRSQGLPVEEINIRQLASAEPAVLREPAAPPPPEGLPEETPETPPQRLAAVLFADVIGFSRLTDEQIPAFVRQFLGRVSRLLRRTKKSALVANTWGDGFFATFSTARAAGQFALQLAAMAARTPWQRYGLPAEMSVRVALHAGPVFDMKDPVTGRPGFWGGHVSRGARIEPVTPPGQVYASQAFAAFARDEEDCDFRCLYVGRTPLAKGYGTFPTYHVTSHQVASAVNVKERRKPPDRGRGAWV